MTSQRISLKMRCLMSPRFVTAPTVSVPSPVRCSKSLRAKRCNRCSLPRRNWRKPQVCFGPRGNDARWCDIKEVLAGSRSIREQPEAPITRTSDGKLPQPIPGDAFTQIGAEGLVVKPSGPDCLVCRPPRGVGKAVTVHAAGGEVLEVAVHS